MNGKMQLNLKTKLNIPKFYDTFFNEEKCFIICIFIWMLIIEFDLYFLHYSLPSIKTNGHKICLLVFELIYDMEIHSKNLSLIRCTNCVKKNYSFWTKAIICEEEKDENIIKWVYYDMIMVIIHRILACYIIH